jgi:hypothetical protein
MSMLPAKTVVPLALGVLLLALSGAACGSEGDDVPDTPAADLTTLTLEDAYSRLAEAITRPGFVFHAVMTMTSEYGADPASNAYQMEAWIDMERGFARLHMPTESGSEPQIIVGDAAYRSFSAPIPEVEERVERYGAPNCEGTDSAALSTILAPDCYAAVTSASVDTDAEYEGRGAIVVITDVESPGDDWTQVYTYRLYLDRETFLPLAARGEGVMERWQDEQKVSHPFSFTVRFEHDFLALDSLPLDFFDPASLGYVPVDPLDRLAEIDPQLTLYWLGETFSGQDDLPPLMLSAVHIPEGPPSHIEEQSPRYKVSLQYPTADEEFGPRVTLREWTLEDWERYLSLSGAGPAPEPTAGPPVTRFIAWWQSPCVQTQEVSLDNGRATIFMGYHSQPFDVSELEGFPCPTGAFDEFIAHVYLGSTVIEVSATGQTVRGEYVENPYNSLEGMQRLVKALEARQ